MYHYRKVMGSSRDGKKKGFLHERYQRGSGSTGEDADVFYYISADSDCWFFSYQIRAILYICWYWLLLIYSFGFHNPASHGSSWPLWASGSFERGEQHCQGGARKDWQGCFEDGFEGNKRVQRSDLWWKRAGEGGSGAGSLVWGPPSLSVSKKIGQDQEPHKKSPTQTSVKWNTGFFNSTRLCI